MSMSNMNNIKKLTPCFGVIRQRTNKFLEYRKQALEENSFNKFETGSSLNDTGKTSLLGKKNTKDNQNTELISMSHKKDYQSTQYLDIFNSTNHLYEELRNNYVILQQEQQKRIIPKFDDEENRKIDKKIKELVIDMTRKVKQADENINLLNRLNFNSRSEQEVKDNMKLNLVTKIKEFSRDFQMNEEEYMKKYQELVGINNKYDFEDLDGSSKYSNKNSKYYNSTYESDNKNDFLQLNSTQDKSSMILNQRDEEINTLLGSITELAGVFKDLQTLVHHQGTILDRIDYNIDTAGQNVIKANENLVKTEKMMRSNCYRNCMLGIILSIFIMGTLILLKFTK